MDMEVEVELEQLSKISRVLKSLPAKQKEYLDYAFREGLTDKEIVSTLGIARQTLRQRKLQTLGKFQRKGIDVDTLREALKLSDDEIQDRITVAANPVSEAVPSKTDQECIKAFEKAGLRARNSHDQKCVEASLKAAFGHLAGDMCRIMKWDEDTSEEEKKKAYLEAISEYAENPETTANFLHYCMNHS